MNRRTFIKNSVLTAPLAILGQEVIAQQPFTRVSKPKIKISLNAYSFNRILLDGKMTLDELIDFSAQHNFAAVDLTGYYFPDYPAVPENSIIQSVKRKAFIQGLDISGTGVRNDFTTPDVSQRQQDIALIKNWIECAAQLGAPMLRIFAGKKVPNGHTRDEVADWITSAICECLPLAQKYGVMLGIQNHAGFLKTAGDTLEILKQVNSNWFGVMLDIGSFRGVDTYHEIAELAPHAISWQIKEKLIIYDKEVKSDLRKVVQIMHDTNYRGYILLETLGAGDPRMKVPRFLAELRDAIG